MDPTACTNTNDSSNISVVTQNDPIRSRLDKGMQQIHGLLCDVEDRSLFDELRAELLQLQMQQRSLEQDGGMLLTAVRMDETTEKIWMDYTNMPAHTSVLCKLESALDAQAFAWGSNLYEDDSVPCEFHRDGDTYSTGTATEDVANLSIVASFGGSRNFAFIHCTTGHEFSFLQKNGDAIAFDRDVDNEFMHGLRPAEPTGESTERISVVIFGRSQISKQLDPATYRLPIPRIVSMSCPQFRASGRQYARLLQFTGVFVSPEQLNADPKELPTRHRRNSILSHNSLDHSEELCQQLGGRIETVETSSEMLGSLSVIVFEPSSRKLDQQPLASIGVVICLQGLPLSSESLQEWFTVAQRAGWLDMGITVIIPNVHMSSAFEMSDYEAVIGAALASGQFNACLLAGKDDGACLCVSIAVDSAVSVKIVGVILAGPSSPPPMASCKLRVPALLLWAIDDEVSHFQERHDWIGALDGRVSATSFQESWRGGHRLDCVLDCEKLASAARYFTASAFLVHELQANECSPVDAISSYNVMSRLDRLSVELPHVVQSLAFECGIGHNLSDGKLAAESIDLTKHLPGTKARRRLSKSLQSWIQADMVITSASE